MSEQLDLFPEATGKNTKNWGMPWMGSKNDIAWHVVNALPKGGTLVDLFCGGCAITHAAMISGRWDRFVMNDVLPTADIFAMAVRGDLQEYCRFVSRQEFNASDDLVVKMLWSFGNDLKSYMWNGDNERLKGYAVRMLTERTLKERRAYWMNFVKELKTQTGKDEPKNERLQSLQSLQSLARLERLQSLERLERLQSLQSLQSLEILARLERNQGDYRAVRIPEDAVVYCDIPYRGTCGYGMDFDHDAFYAWVEEQECPVFVSEYESPLTQVAEWPKRKKRGNPATMKGNGMGSVTERLFFNGTTDEYMELMNRGR